MPKFSSRDFPPLASDALPRRSKRVKGNQHTKSGPLPISENYATINDLPDELLLVILDFLPGIDLENFHFFCEPYLFLRTIITSPHLARTVQNVQVTFGDFAHCERERHTPTAQDKKTIKEGLKSLGISDWKRWATECNAKSAELETLYSAILIHLPSLKTLKISHGHQEEKKIYPPSKCLNLFKRATTNPIRPSKLHRFENLHKLDIELPDATLMDMAPIFHIPSLRVLSIKGANDRGIESTEALQKRIPARCNDLDEIILDLCFIYMDFLEVLIASARGLTSLQYGVNADLVYYPERDEYDARYTKENSSLIEKLACQKSTLESFSLACENDGEGWPRDCLELEAGLRDFPALKHIHCPLGNIANTQPLLPPTPFAHRLPSTLQTLDLVVRREMEDVQALGGLDEKFVSQCSKYTPNLKTIRIHIETQELGFDWAPLVTRFSRIGVEIAIVEEEDDDFGSEGFSERYITPPRANFLNIEARDDLDDTSSRASDEVSLYSN
ncbi:hypothetical protein FB567DRAFT_435770 [Paraphoma chrysanthemicola]|uniref:F-box domain-containing protein n=1 Tax=Paraphoma chrysanthemicola TaxID=798071 RepID=A0A8K0RF09_9PLEO|nr:hypothetical protein FB567DRAFT_435770 [Paraphoma chrysanthemicola]